jgi:hypothetical protein
MKLARTHELQNNALLLNIDFFLLSTRAAAPVHVVARLHVHIGVHLTNFNLVFRSYCQFGFAYSVQQRH